MVPLWVPGVQQDQNQVEATEQRAGQSYVHRQRLVGIVLALRVGSCQDGGPGVQLTHHSVEREGFKGILSWCSIFITCICMQIINCYSLMKKSSPRHISD